jgi:hypothetical protein
MRLSKLFFFVTLITIILTVIQLFGYPVMELVMVMLVVDFMTLAASIQLGSKNYVKNNPIDIEKEVVPRLQKIDSIEKVCTDISNRVSNTEFEEKLKKQGDDISYLLDKMAKKTLDLEERINNFGNGLIDSISNLSNKVKSLEEKEEGESFSLGELVYVEDDKENT